MNDPVTAVQPLQRVPGIQNYISQLVFSVMEPWETYKAETVPLDTVGHFLVQCPSLRDLQERYLPCCRGRNGSFFLELGEKALGGIWRLWFPTRSWPQPPVGLIEFFYYCF